MEALPTSIQPLAVMAGNEVSASNPSSASDSLIVSISETSTSNWVVPSGANAIGTIATITSASSVGNMANDVSQVIQTLPSTSYGPVVVASSHGQQLHFKSKRTSNMIRHMVSMISRINYQVISN